MLWPPSSPVSCRLTFSRVASVMEFPAQLEFSCRYTCCPTLKQAFSLSYKCENICVLLHISPLFLFLCSATCIFIALHTQAAICLHQKISQNFFPTAIRFHYIFNLRDLTNIFQVTRRHTFIHVASSVGGLLVYFTSVE